MSESEQTMSLSERAVITCLSIGVYGGKAVDRAVTEEVSENHEAEKGAGTYSKYLIATRFFKDVNTAASQARAAHNLLTLPWTDDGSRILSNVGYMHYTEQMRLKRINWQAKVDQFCTAEMLESYIKEAKVRLGSMFDETQYPTPEEMAAKFVWDIEINKVPEGGDFRTKLDDKTVKSLVKDIERRSNDRVERAMKDVFTRVAGVTEKMVESLRSYKPAEAGQPAQNNFRSNLISNVVELAQALPTLNVTGDPKINELAAQLVADLTEHSPEVLKTDPRARNDVAKKAEAILKKVNRFI